MTPDSFVRSLSKVSLEHVFNPYSDECPWHDLAGAAAMRRANLRGYLTALKQARIDIVWMGRDLGYKGGRRTGLALTDEAHLSEMGEVYSVSGLLKSTRTAAISERTASEIWAFLRLLPQPPLLWNVFPLHPHEPGNSLSNRKFTKRELQHVHHLNQALFQWLNVKRIVAIGQDAQAYAATYSLDVIAARHPSYGGMTDFRASIELAYDVKRESPQSSLFR